MENVIAIIIVICILFILAKVWKYVLFPIIVKKTTYEIEKNPKWITPKLNQNYYGFSDIDIITAKSTIGALPRFRLNKDEKDKDRLEVLISEDTPVNDIDKIATIALQGKLFVYYNLYFPDKPAYWLSALIYMLEGGDIRPENIVLENKNKRQETS